MKGLGENGGGPPTALCFGGPPQGRGVVAGDLQKSKLKALEEAGTPP